MPANGDDNRPSPETLLKLAKAEEAEAEQAKQGKLKIFLGYAAGVGKTYAMLEAARQRKSEGRDVVVGHVESTAAPRPMPCWQAWKSFPGRPGPFSLPSRPSWTQRA
jgi:K+-sensing histidine kinase KdpD